MGEDTSRAPNVGTIMTPHVVMVTMDDTLSRVKEVFEHHRFHHLVVQDGGRVVGVISDRDLLKNISPFVGQMSERNQDRWSLNKRVHQVMTRKLVSVNPATSIREACELLLKNKVSCLPVLDAEERCVGIVTWRDLLGWALVECAGGDRACDVRRERAA